MVDEIAPEYDPELRPCQVKECDGMIPGDLCSDHEFYDSDDGDWLMREWEKGQGRWDWMERWRD